MAFTKLLQRITTGLSARSSMIEKPVNITHKLSSITVIHNRKEVVIERNQDPHSMIHDLFAKTSRPCPPFCVQPAKIAPQVETIAELEMIDYLQQSTKDDSILIIDSRIKEWVDVGTIPGTKNIPWTALSLDNKALSFTHIIAILVESFDVKIIKGVEPNELFEAFKNKTLSEKLDFSEAKTLVLYCNGSWCGQTSKSILTLLELSYPAEKIKYYRDGMQGWLNLGLTTVSFKDSKPSCKLVK